MNGKNENKPKEQALKEKTALTTLSLNVLLTLLKFVLWGFSGSLAVLAEAWHSFSDIGTSFMVYIAIRQEGKREGDADKKPRVTPEQWVSLGIGGFLFCVALLLIWKFIFFEGVLVKYPLVAGLIFLGFSVGSFLVYRFESSVGREHGSVGLVTDGIHALTDMVASLLTGFSLILYYLGLNIDRLIAGIIALFVLSFAVETLANVASAIRRREKEAIFRYKFHTLLIKLFSPKTVSHAGEVLDSRFRIRFFRSPFVRKLPLRLLNLLLLALLTWWMSSCFFSVEPSQQAVVERFGEPLHLEDPLEPGLHFKAPWPVDTVLKVDAEIIRRKNIGNIQDENTFALLWSRRHGTEIPFLSGDNNYFYPYLVLHYRIKNISHYLYRHTDPEGLMDGVAHQVVGKIFATKAFYDIVLSYREQMVRDVRTGIQAGLDQMEAGIEIVDVAVKDVHPPIITADSYETVIAEIQEKERMINEGLAYRNEKLPETRGEAIRFRQEAEGYALEQPLRAKGDAEIFLRRIPDSERSMNLTMKRLYLSTILESLSGRGKIIIDPRAGQPEIWLNMKELLGRPGFDLESGQF